MGTLVLDKTSMSEPISLIKALKVLGKCLIGSGLTLSGASKVPVIDLALEQCDSSSALFMKLIPTASVDSLSIRVEGCLPDKVTRMMEARFSSGLGLVATEMSIVSMAVNSSHRLNLEKDDFTELSSEGGEQWCNLQAEMVLTSSLDGVELLQGGSEL
nr:hypothetical protein CFP56_47937 [Quercus suber]